MTTAALWLDLLMDSDVHYEHLRNCVRLISKIWDFLENNVCGYTLLSPSLLNLRTPKPLGRDNKRPYTSPLRALFRLCPLGAPTITTSGLTLLLCTLRYGYHPRSTMGYQDANAYSRTPHARSE